MRRWFVSALSRGSAVMSVMSLAACAMRPAVAPGEPPRAPRSPVVVACTRVDTRTGLPYFEPSAGKGGLVVRTDEHDEIFVDGWRVGSGSACVEVPPGNHHVRHGNAGDPRRRSFVSVGPGKLIVLLMARDVSGLPPSVVEDLRRDTCGQPEPAATSSPPPERR